MSQRCLLYVLDAQNKKCYFMIPIILLIIVPGKPDMPFVQAFDDTSVNVTFRNSNFGGLPTKFRVYVRAKGKICFFMYISFLNTFVTFFMLYILYCR